MWDDWEKQFDCTNRVTADRHDYCRIFNKASVKNWGTSLNPGPTLNLMKLNTGICRGIAFQFPDEKNENILSYLKDREGKNFQLVDVNITLEDNSKK